MKLAQLVAQTGEQEAVIQILCHLLSLDRTAVFLLDDISDDTVKQVKNLIKRYQEGMPLAYLLGYTYFYDRKFLVNKNVLVPRFDTEVLVELAEKKIITDSVIGFARDSYKILDMCCGSGVIGICLAYLTDWLNEKNPENHYEITLADVSKNALTVARANARAHGVDLKFVQSDLFTDVIGKYDLIVCNPPYVRTTDIGLEDQRVLQEPRLALDGGIDGLYYYRRILATAQEYLYPEGMIIFEVGFDQANAIKEIAESNGYSNVRVYKDLANHDRVVTIRV